MTEKIAMRVASQYQFLILGNVAIAMHIVQEFVLVSIPDIR